MMDQRHLLGQETKKAQNAGATLGRLGSYFRPYLLVLLAVAVVGPLLWATVYRKSRPDRDDPSTDLLGAAVTGRFLRGRRRRAADRERRAMSPR